MAVNIIVSPTFEYAKAEILRRISENNTKGSSHVVIVPDRHSLSYQRAVIEELGLVSVSNIEVVSFSRLADLNISKDKRYLTPQSAVMLMRKVINKNKDNLLRYRRSSSNVGFADEMFAVVSDIRNSNISKETIKDKLPSITNVAVRNKISDIATLYSGYIEELEKSYFDATSKFGALIDIIDDIDILSQSYVYVCDYYEFTNVELVLLEKIMNRAKSMDISLVEKEKGSNARIFPRLSQKIVSMAKKNNLSYTIKRNEMPSCPSSLIYDNLFGYVNDIKDRTGKPIHLKSARNIEEELSYVCSNIRKSVREKNYRYRDIAIAVSDLDGYKDTLRTVMDRYDIPYYIDDKVPVMSAPSVRHILMALEVVQNRYKRSDMISYLMNGLTTDITNDEKDIFTNYVVRYDIDRTRFLNELTLSEDGEDMTLINDIRTRMLKGFDILSENNKDQEMKAHIDSIYKYMDDIDYVDRINAYAKRQFDLGYKIESEITTQAPKKLFKFFDELLMVAGDELMSQREFLDILLASLQRVDISLIPKFNDSVYVGDISNSRYDKVKDMYFVGTIQGKVPMDMSSGGIMGQTEVDIFASLGMAIEPSPKEKNLLGRFYILELLLKSENDCYLTYPIEGIDGKECKPSIVMKQLSDIYDMKITSVDRDEDILGYMSTYDNANYLTASNYGKYSYMSTDLQDEEYKIATFLRDEGKFKPFDYRDEEYVKDIHDLYFVKDRDSYRMSASRIERYLGCPYRAYLQYAVGLKERKVADIKITEVGTILHAMLEKLYGKEITLSADKKCRLTDAEIVDFVRDFVYSGYDFEPKIMHELYNRCLHVALKTYNMTRTMTYQPIFVEREFKDIDYNFLGNKYKLSGAIDRIDGSDNNSYLVDYKSSSKVEFELKNIYYGDRVQLVIYADIFRKLDKKDIVGLFYLPMPSGYKKVEDKADCFKFSGIMSKEDLAHMPEGIYPYKIKELKSGSKIEGSNGVIIDKQDFEIIIDYVHKLIENTIADIKDGYIGKNPFKGSCEYCDYKNICGMFGEDINGRKMKKADMTALGKEADNE